MYLIHCRFAHNHRMQQSRGECNFMSRKKKENVTKKNYLNAAASLKQNNKHNTENVWKWDIHKHSNHPLEKYWGISLDMRLQKKCQNLWTVKRSEATWNKVSRSLICDASPHVIMNANIPDLYVLFQWPWTLHSQCKVNTLPNLETGRSKTLIYDTSRQLNLNANAFSTEPADYNLNCQANWLLTAILGIRWGAAGEMCRGEQEDGWSWIFQAVLKGSGSLMTTKENFVQSAAFQNQLRKPGLTK